MSLVLVFVCVISCLGLHHLSCRGSDVMIFVVRYPWSDPLRPVDVYIVNHFGGRGTPVLRIGRTSQSGRGCDGHSKRSWGWVFVS